jgi:hypothetical protein
LASEYSNDAAELVQVIKAMESKLAKSQLTHAYADSMKVIWITMCGLADVALMINFLVKAHSMDIELAMEQWFKCD